MYLSQSREFFDHPLDYSLGFHTTTLLGVPVDQQRFTGCQGGGSNSNEIVTQTPLPPRQMN